MTKTRQTIVFVLAVLLFGVANHAARAEATDGVEAASLLFSADEKRAIEAALALRPPENPHMPDGGKAQQLQVPDDQPSWRIERLHLSALIYYGPRNWTLWFGGRQVRQGAAPPYMTNLSVTANYVDMSVAPRPGAIPIPVRLRPNQTFLIDQLRIAEGGQIVN